MLQIIVRNITILFYLIFSSAVFANENEHQVIIGNKEAKVEVIEYMSLTCSHCAQFHNESLKKIKPKYVDTGKIKLILRDFPLDGIAYQASIVSHCVGRNNPNRYYGFVSYLFEQQRSWATSENPMEKIAKMAMISGLNKKELNKCLENKKLGDKILRSRQIGEKKYDIKSTPTLIINGKVYPGAISFSEFEQILLPLISK